MQKRNQYNPLLGCARKDNKEECEALCGHGAAHGTCQWRESNDMDSSFSTNYSTCSPDTFTCPDLMCDELEQKDFKLCPQDCAGNCIYKQYFITIIYSVPEI